MNLQFKWHKNKLLEGSLMCGDYIIHSKEEMISATQALCKRYEELKEPIYGYKKVLKLVQDFDFMSGKGAIFETRIVKVYVPEGAIVYDSSEAGKFRTNKAAIVGELDSAAANRYIMETAHYDLVSDIFGVNPTNNTTCLALACPKPPDYDFHKYNSNDIELLYSIFEFGKWTSVIRGMLGYDVVAPRRLSSTATEFRVNYAAQFLNRPYDNFPAPYSPGINDYEMDMRPVTCAAGFHFFKDIKKAIMY